MAITMTEPRMANSHVEIEKNSFTSPRPVAVPIQPPTRAPITPMIWLASLIIGVIGALVGGWIGTATGLGDVNEFFSISTWLLAILGSVIVIAIWSVITGSRSNANR